MLNNKLGSEKLRFNILNLLVCIIGIILIIQLFNLQIIHGEEYLKQSTSRLIRQTVTEAPRGQILDRNGNILATNKMGFSLNLYKTNVDPETFNHSLLKLINLLEKNGEIYIDDFPININPISFNFENDKDKSKEIQWKKNNNLDESSTAADCLNYFSNKYKVSNMSTDEARKVIGLRYRISKEGYSSSKPFYIAKDVSRQTVLEISEQSDDFPGVNIVVEPIREYPLGSLASHIIGYISKINTTELETYSQQGYTSNDLIGKAGIENVLEEYLKGTKGLKQVEMNVSGSVTSESIIEQAIAGNDVTLTIDYRLQQVTEKALADNINKIKNGGFAQAYNTEGGAAIVMDIKTGEILALASYPNYNPNDFINGISAENWAIYNNPETKSMFNRAIQGAYAPGSTFKMVSAIAALETHVTSIDEFILDKGQYDKAHKPKCWIYSTGSTHGNVNVISALKYSCNYYFYEMGFRMGIDELSRYAKYFGLGSKTGIELPGEKSGTLATRDLSKQWSVGDTLSAVIGQSFNNFTPIQMAQYISMVANGGKKVQPTLIKNVSSATKEEIKSYTNQRLEFEDTNSEDITISQETLDAVYEGMRSVTGDAGGTAYSIFNKFEIEVAGKTGSAEAGKKTNAWFVGFAPYDEPEIAVIVIVENGGHGNYTAEVVLEIMKEYFKLNVNTDTDTNLQEDMTTVIE